MFIPISYIYPKYITLLSMARRSRKGMRKDTTMVQRLRNGQFIATLPGEICRWKHISKVTVLRWSDGGPGRILIEII